MSENMRFDGAVQTQTLGGYQDDDEIDLLELFAALRSRIILITFTTIAGTVLAACYALFMTTPVYDAKSTLVLNSSSSGPTIGQLGGLADLAGVSLGGAGDNSAEQIQDRVTARDFIMDVKSTVNLKGDPYFNATLRPATMIGHQIEKVAGAPEAPTPAEIDNVIVESFRDAVSVDVTKSGVVEITTQHENPTRAAELTNAIVEKVLADLLQEKKDESHARVEYLASELYGAQEELDRAVKAVEVFSVQNRLVTPEDLALVSSQLSDLRQRRERILGYQTALNAISNQSEHGEVVDRETLNTLLNSFPNANDLEFRRLIGWSGNTSHWVWPDATQIEVAQTNINQWLNDIDRQISEKETVVRNNASAAGQLAKLQRDVTVQEAIYKALLQQFESQSVSGGFNGEIGKIFEKAVPATKPSAPRKSLIAALGLVLGLVIGAALALISSMKRGQLYTVRSISDAFGQRPWGAGFGRRLSVNTKNTEKLLARLKLRPIGALEEVAVDLLRQDSKEIALIPTARGDTSRGAALYLASSLVQAKQIALVDLTRSIPTTTLPRVERENTAAEAFVLAENLTLVQPKHADSVTAMSLQDLLNPLRNDHEFLLILVPAMPDSGAIVSASLDQANAAIVLAKPGQTTRDIMEHVRTILSRHTEVRPYLIAE